MTTDLANPQKCIVLRNGLEVWVDFEKANEIEIDWVAGKLKGPFRVSGRVLNTADITGIVLPEDMVDMRKRKNGEWKCHRGTWHDRGAKCECATLEEANFAEQRRKLIEACPDKCGNGWVTTESGAAAYCSCVRELMAIQT